ncbi:hypothetical protein PIB30_032001 [Stylosanthes scabra]|uniref:RRM domain-containing protein n=1 Tax=Stylosanthes scabra TaxID=79078 RepID=A0ABU6VA33_9FABA|nr:hypothetical protein [Stylosanthes scabra]
MDKGPNFVPGKLYVGFVPPTMNIGQFLQDHFAKYGKITDTVIINDDITGTRYGYGFIKFADPSAVDKAIKDNDRLINDHLIRVERSRLKVRSIDQEDYKTNRLFVYLIPKHVSLDALSTFFGEYGKVITCRRERGKHYGFVYFQSAKTVDDILAAHGHWINFRGKFMLEISKHKLQRHLDNADRSREGGDSVAQIPPRTAAYSPAGQNTSSGLRHGNRKVVKNQLWQPYGSYGNVYGSGGEGAMVPSIALPKSIGYGCYYPPPTMYNPQYGTLSHYGYGGAMGGYYAGHYDRHNVVGSAGIPQEGSGSGGSLNATSQVDNSTSLFSYPMVTQGASGSGGSSNANQDDNPDSLFSYQIVRKKGL